MTTIGLFAAFLTIFAAGFGLANLIAQRRLTLCEYLALPWLLGTSMVTISLSVIGCFIRGLPLQLVVAALAISLGVIGLKRWRRIPAGDETWSKADGALGFLFALEMVLLVWISFQHTLGWDGLTVWELKARYAFLNGGVLAKSYFNDTARWFSHPEYPLLLPLTETWLYLWIGEANQFVAKLVFPFWYLAAMAMLFRAATVLTEERRIAWMVVLLFPLVPAIHAAPGGIEVGYADLPLAAIYISAISYLLRYRREGTRDSLWLFVALTITLPWMKQDGAILWLIISVCGALVILHRAGWTVALLSFLPGILIIASWKLFLASAGALSSRDFLSVSFGTLRANLSRTGTIFRELIIATSDTSLWHIFWLLVVLAVACVLIRDRSWCSATILGLLVAPLVCYCASYIFSAWPNFLAHIDTSLPRLLIQLTPVGWLVIGLAMAPTQPELPGPQPTGQSARGMDCS